MNVLVVQHDADKGLGLFAAPLAAAGLELDVRFAGHDALALADHAAVIALPGVANPVDPTSAVDSTRDLLRQALEQGLPCSASASERSCWRRRPAAGRCPAGPNGGTAR